MEKGKELSSNFRLKAFPSSHSSRVHPSRKDRLCTMEQKVYLELFAAHLMIRLNKECGDAKENIIKHIVLKGPVHLIE